jgi:hypothetical protein
MTQDIQFKPDDDVQLRNGWPAKVLDVVGWQERCVFIRYRNECRQWDCIAVRADGRQVSGEESPLDLIHKPKRMSGFVNVYEVTAAWHKTREQADNIPRLPARIACIDLSQFEEGEGL